MFLESLDSPNKYFVKIFKIRGHLRSLEAGRAYYRSFLELKTIPMYDMFLEMLE